MRQLRILCIWLALATVAFPQSTSHDVSLNYRFTLNGQPVQGALWLFHYSWYGLEKYKLDDVRDGLAHVHLTPEILVSQVRPHPNVEAFIVALDVAGTGWYRTGDIEPTLLFDGLMASIDAFGVVQSTSTLRQIALAPPVRQTLQFLSPLGEPQARVNIEVETFVYDFNHCGVHEGFGDRRTLRTDEAGRVSFTAPLTPSTTTASFRYLKRYFGGGRIDALFGLYLPISYFTAAEGSYGPTRTLHSGIELDPGADHIVRALMSAGTEEAFTIRVNRSNGRPAGDRDVALMMSVLAASTGTCGSNWVQAAVTDEHGNIRASFSPAQVEHLWFEYGDNVGQQNPRYLSDEEIRTLFKDHKLSVTLPW